MQHKYVRHSLIGFVLWLDGDLAHSDIGATLRRSGGHILSQLS